MLKRQIITSDRPEPDDTRPLTQDANLGWPSAVAGAPRASRRYSVYNTLVRVGHAVNLKRTVMRCVAADAVASVAMRAAPVGGREAVVGGRPLGA